MPDKSANDSADASRSPGLKPGVTSDAKTKLREQFKVLAKNFFTNHNKASLEKIQEQISIALSQYVNKHLTSGERRAPRVAVYRPMKVELPAQEIVSASRAFENPVYLYPQIDGHNMWFTDESDAPAEPEIIIVPGLFVDKEGNRLGRGKGYYDRFLSASQVPIARRIFLGYEFQFIEQVPVTAQDEAVTAVPY